MVCMYRHMSLTYVQKISEPKIYVLKWRNEHSRNKRWVTMKNKGANNEECGDNHDVRLMYMMRAISNEPK